MLNKDVEKILEKVTKEVVSENIDKKETLEALKSKLIEAEKTNFPGMSTYTKISKESGKENTNAYDAISKKIKDYLKGMLDNSNPEFPHQNNSKTDYDSPMYRNSTEQDEYIADWRGGGLEDLEYDTDPGETFKKRNEKYIKGSTETGNNTGKGTDGQQVANVVPSDLGDRVIKKQKRKHKKLKSDEYSFALPNDWTQKPNAGFVSTESIGKKENIISEKKIVKPKKEVISENVKRDMKLIKHLVNYNKKTQ